jgi:hypothetical protein
VLENKEGTKFVPSVPKSDAKVQDFLINIKMDSVIVIGLIPFVIFATWPRN